MFNTKRSLCPILLAILAATISACSSGSTSCPAGTTAHTRHTTAPKIGSKSPIPLTSDQVCQTVRVSGIIATLRGTSFQPDPNPDTAYCGVRLPGNNLIDIYVLGGTPVTFTAIRAYRMELSGEKAAASKKRPAYGRPTGLLISGTQAAFTSSGAIGYQGAWIVNGLSLSFYVSVVTNTPYRQQPDMTTLVTRFDAALTKVLSK